VTLLKHVDSHSGAIHWTGESEADLLAWLCGLSDCPPVTLPELLRCDQHEDNPPFCGFVQADPQTGVARRRCVACATVTDLFDSGERWTFPDTFECPGCRQSLVELAVGISTGGDGTAEWLALAARCVGCGRISGLTDRVLGHLPIDQVLAGV
jgi:hypothetical protein